VPASGQGAGHGQRLHGRSAAADLGQQDGDLEHAETVGRGHVEQAGLGERLPGIGAGQHLSGQAGDRLLALPQREIHSAAIPFVYPELEHVPSVGSQAA
jgi:hypothetical protein